MLNICFALGVWDFGYALGRGCIGDPSKILGPETLMSFPGRQHFTHVITLLLDELNVSL